MISCVVVMGVAGSGKSTVGQALAERLGWAFVDADHHHPPANVDKMRGGIPLDDADRLPWLDALHAVIADHGRRREPLVLACSVLKRRYRERLGIDGAEVRLVHLAVDAEELRRRIEARTGHFLPAGLLASQLADLEAPAAEEAVVVDATMPVDALVTTIVESLPAG